jgi:hypothetical protein
LRKVLWIRFNFRASMERIYEKYAWVLLLVVGLLWLMVGIFAVFQPEGIGETDVQSVTNMPWSELKASSPVATNFVTFVYGQSGLHGIHAAFFVIAITLTGYRRGEKWAWYFMWSVPVYLVSGALFAAVFIGDVSQMLEFVPITTIALLGLLLPYRKFFPRQPPSDHSNIS